MRNEPTRRAVIGAAIALLATGCAGGSALRTPDRRAVRATFSYRLPDKQAGWLTDLRWLPLLERQTGIGVELVSGGPSASYDQRLDLALGNGELQDAVIANLAQADIYGPQGAFLDLAPLIRRHAPHIQRHLDSHPELRHLVTDKKGRIYGLPSESPRISRVTFCRADHFERAGLTENPRTVEEFTDALRALRRALGSTTRNYYPLSGRDSFLRWPQVFGAQLAVVNGTVRGINTPEIGDLTSPGFAEMIRWYRTLYAEKLIDPEFVSGAASEDSWQQKMLGGRASVAEDFFTRPSWFLNNGGPDNDPKFAMKVLPPFLDRDGQVARVPADPRWDVTEVLAVNASSKRSRQVLAFLDHLYSRAGQTTMHYGKEGVSYEVVGGQPRYTVTFEVESNRPEGTPAWNFLQDRMTFPAPVDNQAYYRWVDKFTRSFAEKYFASYLAETPVIKYDADQLRERTNLLATFQPWALSELVKFVTGKRAPREWDAFVGEAKDERGYDRLQEIEQAAWDATHN